MRIRQPGKITDGLWCLGSEASNIYLLEGEDASMIVSGGMSYLVPTIMAQFEAYGIDETRIRKLLILHAHFDHIGAVPFLKRRHSELEVYASARGWEILRLSEAIETINSFGRHVATRMGFEDVYARYDIEWRDDIIGTTVKEGDRLGVQPLEGIVFETPGHSSCSVSLYVPAIKALFPSDGGGIPYKEMIIASGNSNFTQYQESLDRLKDLDVAFLCADHYGYVAGAEAGNYIQESIRAARARRAELEEVYRQSGDMKAATRELVNRFFRQNPDYLLTPEIYAGVCRQMLRHIVREMENA